MTVADSDDATLDALQRAAFDYFLTHTRPDTGLVADTSREGSPCSIAVVGLAMSAYPVGVARGWIDRADAVARCLAAMRFFSKSDQSAEPGSTGHRGFYFHFLDMDSGARVWESELSMIDTAFLVAGMLTAALWFDADSADERELRELADGLYRRVDWRWAQEGDKAIRQGWKPDSGFFNYGWDGYSEALLLYALGLGSPDHPITDASFHDWTLTYQWEDVYGHEFLYAGPLFIHHFSHAWVDLRGIRDAFMREKDSDYFENSRRAVHVQREYALRNPRSFAGYGENNWGLSAGDGPNAAPRRIAGREQKFAGYAARGVPFGPDDGTIAGPATLCSLAFAPELVWPVVRRWIEQDGAPNYRRLLASGFNATLSQSNRTNHVPDAPPWISPGTFGLDQGMIVLMLENARTGLPWKLGRANRYVVAGLRRAGFSGGWL